MNALLCADKRDIVEQVNHLETHEQEDVFLILKSHGVLFSQNGNGIFINMKNVKDEIMNEINDYITNLQNRKKWTNTVVSASNVEQTEELDSLLSTQEQEQEQGQEQGQGQGQGQGQWQGQGQRQRHVQKHNNIIETITQPVLNNENEEIVRTLIANLENDRGNTHSAKNFYGKFQTAKKKYAKPCSRADDTTIALPIIGLCKQMYLMESTDPEPSAH
jgi:hypothetical protein